MSADPAERTDVDSPAVSDPHARQSSADGDSEPDAPADLMVVSRARRANAGNRMSTLLAKSAEEEQWGEEWEEVANEEEFVGEDTNEQEDYNLDSSSSEDEDDGADDETGEKELRKAERQEKIKKRKTAANPFAARFAASSRKRVKLDVPTPDPLAPPPRPKKKSERASWIPLEEDGPVRTSSRKQTMANKEHTMAKLKEKDQRRDETLAMMKAAEARKAKDEPKPQTQAERLTEAARVERINKKTLHRWEEAEELRAAERQAKIDALKNRQIDGPFIRFYSGPAVWVDDKIKYTGKDAPKIEELEDKLNKEPSASTPNPDDSAPHQEDAVMTDQPQVSEAPHTNEVPQTSTTSEIVPAAQPVTTSQPPAADPPAQVTHAPMQDIEITSTAPSSMMLGTSDATDSFLFGMEQYALPNQPHGEHSNPQLYPNASQPDLPPNPFLQPSQTHLSFTPSLFSQDHTQQQPHPQNQNMHPPSLLPPFQTPQSLQPTGPPIPAAPPRRKVIRRALRNLLVLSSFPSLENTAHPPSRARTTATLLKEKDRAALVHLSTTLFAWSPAEANTFVTAMLNAPKTKKEKEALAKPKKELCAVSNKEARYRDPETGIAYRDSRAFGVLRGVVGGGFVWCGELGCYVGGRAKPMQSRGKGFLGMAPAAGVPKRFLEMQKSGPVSAGDGGAEASGPPPTTEAAPTTAMPAGAETKAQDTQAPPVTPAAVVKTETAPANA